MKKKEEFEKFIREELVEPTLLLLEKAGIVEVREDRVVLTEKGRKYAKIQLEHLDIEKAIKKLFEAYGELLGEIKELKKELENLQKDFVDYKLQKARILIDSEVVSKEVFELGKYKQERCYYYRKEDGKCEAWVYSKTGELVTPSLARCALCWLFRQLTP